MTSIVDRLVGLPGPALLAVVGLLAMTESAALVGLVVPGELALLAGGFAASQGRVALASMVVVATVAAILGDSLGYELGRWFGPAIRASGLGRRIGEQRWGRAESTLRERGGPAVLLGRWIGVLRALVPGVAGMTRMPYRTFVVWNIAGALLWGPTVVIAGYLAGSGFRRVERWLGRASLLMVAVGLAAAFLWWSGRWAVRHRDHILALVGRVRASRPVAAAESLIGPLVRRVAESLRPRAAFTVLVTAATLGLGFLGFAFEELADAVAGRNGLALLDRPVASWLASRGTPEVTAIMRVVSSLGHVGVVVAAVSAGLTAWVLARRWLPLAAVAAAIGGAAASTAIVRVLVTRSITPGAMPEGLSGSVLPSPHAAVALAAAGGLAWLIARGRTWQTQVWAATAAVAVTMTLGLARAYLGERWMSEVVAGWIIGAMSLIAALASATALGRPPRGPQTPSDTTLSRAGPAADRRGA